MLVLALQFSKGVARRWQFVWYTTPSTPPAVERNARAMREGRSLKTEEKTRSGIERRQEGNLRLTTQSDEPTSAPTGNWFAPGRTSVDHR